MGLELLAEGGVVEAGDTEHGVMDDGKGCFLSASDRLICRT